MDESVNRSKIDATSRRFRGCDCWVQGGAPLGRKGLALARPVVQAGIRGLVLLSWRACRAVNVRFRREVVHLNFMLWGPGQAQDGPDSFTYVICYQLESSTIVFPGLLQYVIHMMPDLPDTVSLPCGDI
jgi:hypothetical protein